MFSSSPWTRALVVVLVSTVATSRVFENKRDDGWSGVTSWLPWGRSNDILRRDGTGTTPATMNSDCLWLCELGGCSNGNACGRFGKRNEHPLGHPLNPYRAWNHTTDKWDVVSESEYASYRRSELLFKRAFSTDLRWNAARLNGYLAETHQQGDLQFQDHWYYIVNTEGGLNEGTRSEEKVFTQVGAPFQLGCGGLHGCTVMTLVSDRAVYMAHYWEVYALNADDELAAGTTGQTKFQQRVLNTISVTGDQDSQTRGGGVTWDNYNHDGDNARLLIMTPGVDDWDGNIQTAGPQQWKYQNKVKAMIALVQENIPGVAVSVMPYKRLNYHNNGGDPTGPDVSLVGTTARGMAYFQYDGTTAGQYWRLFYEYMVYKRGDRN